MSNVKSRDLYGGGGSTPVPDPTERTTEALLREISALKEIFTARLGALEKEQDSFFAGRSEIHDDISRQISHLKELLSGNLSRDMSLVTEKFSGVQTQFKERDIAVQAALQAAKEAVGEQNKSNSLSIAKSETATTKQIDQLQVMIQAAAKSSDDKLADLKERTTRIESFGVGARGESDHGRANIGIIVSVMALLVSLAFLAITVIHNATSQAPVVIQQPK